MMFNQNNVPAPHKVHIYRKRKKVVAGTILNDCERVYIYRNVPARILPLRNLEENRLEEAKPQGLASSNERKILLFPRTQLPTITKNFFVEVPWGNRPNTYTPPNIPNNAGPIIVIDTPTGLAYLKWNGTQYTDGIYTLEISDITSTWILTGPSLVYDFNTAGSFVCLEFPEGYQFKRSTGKPLEFRVIRVDEQQDDLGRTAFYTLFTELEDHKGTVSQ